MKRLIETSEIVKEIPTLNYTRIQHWIAQGEIVPTRQPKDNTMYFTEEQRAKILDLNRIFDEEKAIRSRRKQENEERKKGLLNRHEIKQRLEDVNYVQLNLWLEEGKLEPAYISPKGKPYFKEEQLAQVQELNRLYQEEKAIHSLRKQENEERKKGLLNRHEIKQRLDGVNYVQLNLWLDKGEIEPAYISPKGKPYFKEEQLEQLQELKRVYTEEKAKKDLWSRQDIIQQEAGLSYKKINLWLEEGEIEPAYISPKGTPYFTQQQVDKFVAIQQEKKDLLLKKDIIQRVERVNYEKLSLWEETGELTPAYTTPKGTAYFKKEQLQQIQELNRLYEEEMALKEQKKKEKREQEEWKKGLLTIREIRHQLEGIEYKNIQRWRAEGKLKPAYMNPKGTAYFKKEQLQQIQELNRLYEEEMALKEQKKKEKREQAEKKKGLLTTRKIIHQLEGINYKKIQKWRAEGKLKPAYLSPKGKPYFKEEQLQQIQELNRLYEEEVIALKEQKKKEKREQEERKKGLLLTIDILRLEAGLSYYRINRWVEEGKIKPVYITPKGKPYFEQAQLAEIRTLNKEGEGEKAIRLRREQEKQEIFKRTKGLLLTSDILRLEAGLSYYRINRWVEAGKLIPAYTTPKGSYYFKPSQLAEIRALQRLKL